MQGFVLVLAGYETTGNALGFALYLLAAHPEQQARLVEEVRRFGMDRRPSYESLEELPFVEACLKEALRLYPPAPTHIRWGFHRLGRMLCCITAAERSLRPARQGRRSIVVDSHAIGSTSLPALF